MGMTRIVVFGFLAVAVTACGVQRPLIRPKDIPAYEEEQRKKREKIEREHRELQEQREQQQKMLPPGTP